MVGNLDHQQNRCPDWGHSERVRLSRYCDDVIVRSEDFNEGLDFDREFQTFAFGVDHFFNHFKRMLDILRTRLITKASFIVRQSRYEV